MEFAFSVAYDTAPVLRLLAANETKLSGVFNHIALSGELVNQGKRELTARAL
jgi:hypothetical protein